MSNHTKETIGKSCLILPCYIVCGATALYNQCTKKDRDNLNTDNW